MALSPKLDFRQSQALVMTPQLMQSIKLLQMTHLELELFLDLEIEKNPLLDRAEAANDDFADADATFDGQDTADDDPAGEGPADDEPWQSSIPDAHAGSGGDYDIDQVTAAVRASLADLVAQQIALTFPLAPERFIATALADALDESGYLRCDLAELAQKLGVGTGEVERILGIVQGFDPPGLFARDLRECLAIQLRLKDRFDPAMAALIDHLDLLARRDFATLTKLCGVDQADIFDMLAEIRTLNPKPGALFDGTVAEVIVPDAVVTRSRDGGWLIELNPAAMPRLIVNNAYYAEVSAMAKGEDKAFLADCMQTASWLARSLDQRARTILKVTQEIVRQQDGFLRHGVTHLKPLNLRTVAEAVGMHESTISRVTANKFMETPRGVFELRYFFTASIASAEGGDAHSAESVRHRIRQMIDTETADDVLSDDAIVDALKKDGVDIARRTVAKYRESMNIASSVQRRREKKAKLSIS